MKMTPEVLKKLCRVYATARRTTLEGGSAWNQEIGIEAVAEAVMADSPINSKLVPAANGLLAALQACLASEGEESDLHESAEKAIAAYRAIGDGGELGLAACECDKLFPAAQRQTDSLGDVVLCPECAEHLAQEGPGE